MLLVGKGLFGLASHYFKPLYFQKKDFKVCVVGSAGGIGQPLSLLLKMNPLVTRLSMYDLNAPMNVGAAIDLYHMHTPCKVEVYNGPQYLPYALCDSSIVILLAGMCRKPKQTRDDLFEINAQHIFDLTCAIANYCPCAFICIVTNPVNILTPLVSEVMAKFCVYDPAKIFGVTTLDLIRASTFASEVNYCDPRIQYVPVIGGHSVDTTLPLFSNSRPCLNLTEGCENYLFERVKDAGGSIVDAKCGAGSSTLTMAYAQARFADALLRALSGQPNVIECTFVRSCCTASPYFSNPVLLGPCGVKTNYGVPPEMSAFEKRNFESVVKVLQSTTKLGAEYVKKRFNCC